MILYLDTSALVKHYIQEDGSEEISSLIEKADIAGTVSVAYAEMASALSKSVRMGWVEQKGAEGAWFDFKEQWRAFTRINITNSLLEKAGQLAWEYELRGYDAVHLAAALTWQEMMETTVSIATYDKELWKAAQKLKMEVLPDGLVK